MDQIEFQIVVAIPSAKPAPYKLTGERVGLGRGADNQINVDHHAISGLQCEFRRTIDKYVIIDSGSRNGTRVNGRALKEGAPMVLNDGDRILLSEEVPLYFYKLKAGQKIPDVSASAATDAASIESAATLAAMGDKISAMKKQQEELAHGIETMKTEFQKRHGEVQKVKGQMQELEKNIQAKRQAGVESKELTAMEDDLLNATRKYKIMASDLEVQQAKLSAIDAAVPAVTTAAPGGPPVAQPVAAPAAPTQPVAAPAQPAAAPTQPVAAPAQPAAKKAVAAPGAPAIAKKRPAAGPKTVPLAKAPGGMPVLKKQDDKGPPSLKKRAEE